MKKYIILVTLFYWFAVSSVYAVRVDSIYGASIPLASQSVADRVQAEQQALLFVLAKVSGNSHVFDDKNIIESAKNADSLVDEFSYSASPKTPEMPYVLNVRFDAGGVNRLLRNAGIRIWGLNRPQILVWMEYEEPKQEAAIIESSSSNPIQGLLKQYALDRGLPIMLPTMDMTDINKISVNDVMTMALPTIQEASKRYGGEALLIVRVFKKQEGYAIQSKLMVKQKEAEWNISGKSLEDVIAILMNNVADNLAGRYAGVVASPAQLQINLKVTGVSEEGDLADLMKYMAHLTSVVDVTPIRVDGSDVLLKIVLRSNKEDFTQSLMNGQKMFPIDDSNDSLLHYQWTHS